MSRLTGGGKEGGNETNKNNLAQLFNAGQQ